MKQRASVVIIFIVVVFEILSSNLFPSTFEDLESKALKKYKSGKVSEAIAILEKVIKDKPERFSAFLLLGSCYVKQKNWLKASENLTEAVRLNDRSFDAQRMLGISLMRTKTQNMQSAINHFNKAMEIISSGPDTHSTGEIDYYLSFCYFTLKQYNNALLQLEKLVRVKPQNREVLYWRLWSKYHVSGCYDALLESEEYLKLDPGKKDVLILRGTCLLELKNYNGLIECGKTFQQLHPDMIEGYHFEAQGNIFMENPDFISASGLLNQALALDSDSSKVYYYLGQCYEAQNEFTKAKEYYEKSLSLDQTNCECYFRLGQVLEILGKHNKNRMAYLKEAMQVYKQGMEKCPNHTELIKRISILEKFIN